MYCIRHTLKKILANTIFYSGLFRIRLACIDKEEFPIFTYHRILPKEECGEFDQPGMYVYPATFEKHLLFLKKYFEIKPLSDLCVKIKTGSVIRKKHTCYITFDDGWRDFYTYAYPLLIKHNIPATVFLPTDFIGSDSLFWTNRLSKVFDLAKKNGVFDEVAKALTIKLGMVDLGKFSDPGIFFEKIIDELKKNHKKFLDNIIEDLEIQIGISRSDESSFLDWDQISKMKLSGLIDFGSHTKSHSILTTLTDEEVREEINGSKNMLIQEKVVLANELMFCYPNGNYDKKICEKLKEEKYVCGFTTVMGWNNDNTSKMEYKRINIHQGISFSKSMFCFSII